jgi:hypothetical protein
VVFKVNPVIFANTDCTVDPEIEVGETVALVPDPTVVESVE